MVWYIGIFVVGAIGLCAIYSAYKVDMARIKREEQDRKRQEKLYYLREKGYKEMVTIERERRKRAEEIVDQLLKGMGEDEKTRSTL